MKTEIQICRSRTAGTRIINRALQAMGLFAMLLCASSSLRAQGTAFTYQGQLNDSGSPANGFYDIRAGLYTTNTGGTVFAGPVTNSAVAVSNGLFTISLDYGNLFDGTAYWLQIAVRSNGIGGFTILSPRQELTPTPYAIFAEGANAAGLSGTIPASSLSGIYGGAVSLTNPANSFAGSGAALTGVNATTLNGLNANNFWNIAGNAGTIAGLNFAGTTDSNPFEIHVSSTRILRVEPDTRGLGAGNVIGGHPANGVLQPGSGGNAIAGGGFAGGGNIVASNSSGVFIGAGSLNQAGPSVNDSVIAGGFANTNGSPDSVIGGGLNNWIQPSSQYSVIGGGYHNLVSDYYSVLGFYYTNNTAMYATVAGGVSNVANAVGAFVGGGGYDGQYFSGNNARYPGSFVGGGVGNVADGPDAVVAGGSGNGSGPYSVVGGGQYNGAGGQWATVGGGQNNQAENWSVVGGGQGNFAGGILASNCTVAGGQGNFAGGSGYDNYATIAGGAFNNASGTGSFIGGGGTDGGSYSGNNVSGNASVIGGGMGNTNLGYGATIGGGSFNTANGTNATVAGGGGNSATGTVYGFSTVGGGSDNLAVSYATVAGGIGNTADGFASFVGGGGFAAGTYAGNYAGGAASVVVGGLGNVTKTAYATIGGGYFNFANGTDPVIGGGNSNTNAGDFGTLGGGVQNLIQTYSLDCTIGGGTLNRVDSDATHAATYSTIAGGEQNTISRQADTATIGGGALNTIGASGIGCTISGGGNNSTPTFTSYGTIPGGTGNTAGSYAFAAGTSAHATDQGAFVWADFSSFDFSSSAQNEFAARARGGVRFVTAINASGTPTAGVSLAAGGTSWGVISDRNVKKNLAPVDGEAVLSKLAQVPVQQWNYQWEPDGSVPHLGPMAQDFKGAFYPGRDDKSITTLEFDGVELAAIQALNQKLNAKETEIQSLKERIEKLERMVNPPASGRSPN